MTSTALQFNNVSKRFGRQQALSKLSFEVPERSVCAFVGDNGAGKTTTFGVVGQYLWPDSGEVHAFGLPISRFRAERGVIGLLPQDMQFFENRSILRQFQLFAELSGLSRRSARVETERVLSLVGLLDRARERPENLSRGMKVRLGVAQALIGAPELILLDEPTAGLDPMLRVQFRSWIENLRGQSTIIVSSHDLSELQTLCDYVCIIQAGHLVRQGPMEEVLGGVYRLRFRVESVLLDWRLFHEKYPGISITSEGSEILLVEFDPQGKQLADVTRAVLSFLLEYKVGVFELTSVRSLEERYLEATGQQASGTPSDN